MSTHRNTGSTPLRARRIARVATALGFAVMVSTLGTMTACSDSPSAPIALRDDVPAYATTTTSTTSTTSTTTQATGLLRDVPLAQTITRSWTIKRTTGGTLDWSEMGLKVTVPANAFSGKEMRFTITALKGDVVAYDFGPDGSQFQQPLLVSQSLKGTNFYKLAGLVRLRGGYFKSSAQVDDMTNTVMVSEFQATETDLSNSQVKFKVTHFSGYMVSTD